VCGTNGEWLRLLKFRFLGKDGISKFVKSILKE
jgi:hypothetical protein